MAASVLEQPLALSLLQEEPEFAASAILSAGDRFAPQGINREAFQQRYEAPPPRPAAQPAFDMSAILAVLTAISAILGARLCLILAGAGALALAVLAQAAPNSASLWAQGIFTVSVFLPIVWLSAKRAL